MIPRPGCAQAIDVGDCTYVDLWISPGLRFTLQPDWSALVRDLPADRDWARRALTDPPLPTQGRWVPER